MIQNNDHKSLAVNGMPDNLPICFGMRPAQSLSDLIRNIKATSYKSINVRKFLTDKFEWQNGFGAFPYGRSQLPKLIAYIENKQKHHRKIIFTKSRKSRLAIHQAVYFLLIKRHRTTPLLIYG